MKPKIHRIVRRVLREERHNHIFSPDKKPEPPLDFSKTVKRTVSTDFQRP